MFGTERRRLEIITEKTRLTALRACGACKYLDIYAEFAYCQHPYATYVEPLWGKTCRKTLRALRADTSKCGPSGIWFEPILDTH